MTEIAQVFEVSLYVSLAQNGAERINFQRSAKNFFLLYGCFKSLLKQARHFWLNSKLMIIPIKPDYTIACKALEIGVNENKSCHLLLMP